jgi:hypothetical protein
VVLRRATGLTAAIRFAAGQQICFLLVSIETGSEALKVSYTVGTGGSFPDDKAAGS